MRLSQKCWNTKNTKFFTKDTKKLIINFQYFVVLCVPSFSDLLRQPLSFICISKIVSGPGPSLKEWHYICLYSSTFIIIQQLTFSAIDFRLIKMNVQLSFPLNQV